MYSKKNSLLTNIISGKIATKTNMVLSFTLSDYLRTTWL